MQQEFKFSSGFLIYILINAWKNWFTQDSK